MDKFDIFSLKSNDSMYQNNVLKRVFRTSIDKNQKIDLIINMINIILVRSLHFGSLGFVEKDVYVVHRHVNIYILIN